MTEGLVRARIRLLKAAWNDTSKYACNCATPSEIRLHGANSLACCKSFEDDPTFTATDPCTCLDGEGPGSVACCEYGNNFLPSSIAGVLFDEVPAEDVEAAIMQKLEPYIQKIMAEPGNNAFTKYNDPEKVKKWNWINSGTADSATKSSGLFSSGDPVMYYNASEAGFPFRGNRTLWETCAGLVGQVRVWVHVVYDL